MINKIFISILLSFLFTFSSGLMAKEMEPFVIASPQATAEIILDPKEDPLVHKAVELFADDVYNITNRRLELLKGGGDSKYQLMVGTIGVDAAFDKALQQAGIDIDKLRPKWEAYVIKGVPDPDGQQNVLFVIGSNARGTAYGMVELSRKMGVSPWEWWADVRPEKKELVTLPSDLFIEDVPKVKYRGVFLNDEDWGLQPWAAKTFEPEVGDIGPKTYEKIFELLLRLKANTIWPAMHPSTKAFYTIPGNKEMAAKYQIFVGTSHAEPMLRNNVGEWDKKRYGDYDYSTNSNVVKNYWQERIEELRPEDKYIITLGMRGIHDSGMQGDFTPEERVEMLEKIIRDQREMLENVLEKDVTDIPQAFVPYKEVLEIYSAGAKIPEDVTLVWADDNHGYIRQLSNAAERKRSGGAGVYYHISYWGRPHDYLWLESVPVSLIWEEMNKAYHTNAKDLWIVNVGDIKPNEIGMNFFLEMAWDPKQFSPESLTSYYDRFATEQFGEPYAAEIGKILTRYFQLGFSRKPEHMGWNGVYPNTPIQDPDLSLFNNGDEVQQRLDAYDQLEKQVELLQEKLPARLKDAFYQLVAYKVYGASYMNKKLLYAYKSREYAQHGNVSAHLYAEKARDAFEKIKEITRQYNRQSDGKWNHMMVYNPRELPVFGMPEVGHVEPTKKTAGGIRVEGMAKPVEGENAGLPTFISSTDRQYFVDVFNAGLMPLKWTAKANDPWVHISKTSGKTSTEERVWVSVDWSLISDRSPQRSTVSFQVGNAVYNIQVKARKMSFPPDENVFVEDNKVVAFQAAHYTSKKEGGSDGEWVLIDGLGRLSDAMGSFPITAAPFKIGNLDKSPALLYEFYSQSTGEARVDFYCLPSQPINNNYGLRFAVRLDGGKPIIVDAALDEEMHEDNEEWKTNVLRAVTIPHVNMNILNKGKHTLEILMVDPGVVLEKIEIGMGDKRNSYFGAPESIKK